MYGSACSLSLACWFLCQGLNLLFTTLGNVGKVLELGPPTDLGNVSQESPPGTTCL